jgi:hypothetical protein
VADFLLRPVAVAELKAAYKWYQGERAGLGEEFLQAVRASVDRAVAGPATYAVVHRDTRRVLVRRFPYGMFFRVVRWHRRLCCLFPLASKAGILEATKVMANPALQRMNTSVAPLPQLFTAERQYRWAY